MNIKTERLTIRKFNKKDIEDLYEIYQDKDICRYLLHNSWTEDNKIEEFNKKLEENNLSKNSSLSLAVELKGKVIGDINISFTEMIETIELGFAFNKKYAKKGYATEAVKEVMNYLFNILNIHRIQANLDARNISSSKLCQRLKMRKEGYFIKDYWNKNEWTDSYIYGILKTEFNEYYKIN